MDRGAWRATVHGVTELDTTEKDIDTTLPCYFWFQVFLLKKKNFCFSPEDKTSAPPQMFFTCTVQHEELTPPGEGQNLNHWITREVSKCSF